MKAIQCIVWQGVELGPLEIKMKSLQKSIDKANQLIIEQQGTWLREQGELVRLTKEKDSQTTNLNLMRKQLTIMSQRKLRIDSQSNISTFFLSNLSDNSR